MINFEAFRPRLDVREQRVLKSIRIRERFLQTFGSVLFSRPQDVAHLLPVSAQTHVVQSTIDVNDVAALYHRRLFRDLEKLKRLAGLVRLSLDAHVRLKPGAETEIVDLLQEPEAHVADSRLARRDHFV